MTHTKRVLKVGRCGMVHQHFLGCLKIMPPLFCETVRK